MKSLSLCTVIFALLATVGLLTATQQPSAAQQEKTPVIPIAGMGIMVGGVTSDSAIVQVRLTETDYLKDGDVPGAPGIV